MARPKYGYVRRGGDRRRRQREWWLVLPLALVIAVVILGLRMSDGGGGLLTGSPCGEGEGCGPVVSVPLDCAVGGSCVPSPVEPAVTGDAASPAITGRAAAVLEEPCGALLYSENAHVRLAPASLTKVATALVAYDRADLSEMVTVRVSGAELSASTDSTVMGLEPGQQLSMRDLLYGLLLPSGNDAALAIAEYVGVNTPAFVEMMNNKVALLGLEDTHFTNPHGLDEDDLYTSAYDIAVLARELLRQPELAAIVGTRTYQPAWDGPPVWNGNRLVYSYPGALGVKIGYTDEAQQTIVAAAERDGRRLIVSVLGSSSIYEDAVALLEWAFSSVESACYASASEVARR